MWLMPWELDGPKAATLNLTKKEREELTWGQAHALCPKDTLCIAAFEGTRRAGLTPFECACSANCITREELALADRRLDFAERFIRPIIEKAIEEGVLPPSEFKIHW